ncbi:hypothetical protein PR202_ga06671 [Eleusine coracana subsp. coracana]|uniref:Clp ATPase C-terminal domain-containing protein n=1 Tax=Eleusine coracana subsp. coracana TaxID=191504 RepID=A0AAV5BXC1_ELECO|nr:hypothetical protein PR202_ga06671 [Eleusine coracana subsp. coracana]
MEEAENKLVEFQQSGKSMLQEEVTDIDIAEIVSKWTGIAVTNLQQSERENCFFLEDVFHKRVICQDIAVLMDEYIVFQPLDTTKINHIVEIQNRYEQKLYLQYTPEAVELLDSLGFDPNYGARPVKRWRRMRLVFGVLKGDSKEDDAVLVDASSTAIAIGLAPQKKLVLQRFENGKEELVAND